MKKNEVETDNTQIEVETEETPEEVPSEKTPTEATLTKEQKSKLDSFDRIYADKKALEEKLEKLTPKEEPKIEEPKVLSQDPREIVRLTKALSGYSDEEVGFIYQNAKSQNLDDVIEATKNPWVSAAIESQRLKVAQEKKIPESGEVPGSLPKGEITTEDIEKDPDVHKKAFDKLFEETQETGI